MELAEERLQREAISLELLPYQRHMEFEGWPAELREEFEAARREGQLARAHALNATARVRLGRDLLPEACATKSLWEGLVELRKRGRP